MRFRQTFLYGAGLALARTVSTLDTSQGSNGILPSLKNLLQVSPAFSGDGITMFPGLHPNHDSSDPNHLVPDPLKTLYYSQEGHRPAMHGSKHSELKAKFNRPTVVLDHSNLVDDIQCNNDSITVCFNDPLARQTAQNAWNLDSDHNSFNFITYHVGCGDETGHKRSMFQVSQPIFNRESSCVKLPAVLIDESDALVSGELTWGTYQSPLYRKREPVKGHVRFYSPDSELDNDAGDNGTASNATVDLTSDPEALESFFNITHIDTSSSAEEAADSLDFASYDGELSKRGAQGNFFERLIEAAVAFTNQVISSLSNISKSIQSFMDTVRKYGAKVINSIMTALKHKFKAEYHDDYRIKSYLTAPASDKPPHIFGISKGYTLAKTTKIDASTRKIDASTTLQCAKCGVEGRFQIGGNVAFSIANGITDGEVYLDNVGDFDVHAQFGITMEAKAAHSKDRYQKKKHLRSVPLSPIQIPGIFILGPQVSIKASMSLELQGQANLLVGGTVSIKKGQAHLNLVERSKNKFTGFGAEFKPVAMANGSINAIAELGLPIAIECGLDILNGKHRLTVGLINTPSVYISASTSGSIGLSADAKDLDVSINADSGCKGIDISTGVKNRIHAEALERWEYEFRDDKIFEKSLGCITVNGPNRDPKEASGIFTKAAAPFGGEAALKKYTQTDIDNVAAKLRGSNNKQGFRILTDAQEKYLLVSGNDGHLYFADKNQYEISAPWGSVNTKAGVMPFDTFGRLLSFNADTRSKTKGTLIDINALPANKMPITNAGAALSKLKSEPCERHQIISFVFSTRAGEKEFNREYLYYPTACKIPGHGLRLYASDSIIGEGGKAFKPGGHDKTSVYVDALKKLGLGISPGDCRTVQLVTQTKKDDDGICHVVSDNGEDD